MRNEEWLAAVRKWAKFWRKVKVNQMCYHGRNSLNQDNGAAAISQPRASAAYLLSATGYR
jgi:hypothetical protein